MPGGGGEAVQLWDRYSNMISLVLWVGRVMTMEGRKENSAHVLNCLLER